MKENIYKCYTIVGGNTCRHCNSICIKHGKINNRQRYKCKGCSKTFMSNYKNNACLAGINTSITGLLKEGCGIRSISRLLRMSSTTVLKRIILIAKKISKPVISFNKTYEVDEMRTFYKSKKRLLWIVYAFRRDTKSVTDFVVGTRTIKTLQRVIDTILLSNPNNICTDKLHLYKSSFLKTFINQKNIALIILKEKI